jgi:histidyl-tRNA synthetase
MKALLERAASDGYTAFATVAAGAGSVDVRPLG